MALADPKTTRPMLLGTRHMVSAGHPLAAAAGLRMLEAGGNAVDAGVAAGFVLNVVHCDMASLGGVAPIMLRMAGQAQPTTFAGVGRWPRLATRAAVSAAGNGRIPVAPQRWVVPAAVDSWLAALAGYGTRPLPEVLEPALDLARNGFPVHYFMAANLAEAAPRLLGWPGASAFVRDGRVLTEGEVLRQGDLADTLQHLADAAAGSDRVAGITAARDLFYRGEIARIAGAFSESVGGFLRAEDMNAFAVPEVAPVRLRYRDRDVFACGPWSQGPAVPQMLAIHAALGPMPEGPAARAHRMIETAKRALTDRNRHYGDPEVVDVPIGRLLSRDHARELAATIHADHIGTEAPERLGEASPDTTYVCVIDGQGNAFSAVPSDSSMLVTPMVPGLGFGLSDRGLQASLDPADPNVVAPGKRPRLTPNPGIVAGEDTVMPYGSPGGDVQTQAMFQFLVNRLDLGQSLQAAVETPRWASFAVPATEDPHPATPGLVRVEAPLADEVGAELDRRGHVVQRWPRFASLAGGVCAIERDARTGVLTGAADPRRMSYAIGW